MSAWVARAPGKVNLTLYVARPRGDGYHPLASVVQPLSLADEVRLEPAPPGADRDEVVCAGVDGDNLALRALAAYREATGWDAPPQRLTIAKRVPVAAGMGGGSADAAATLRLAAAAHGRSVPPGLAATLGADVPALLHGGRVLMTGIGEHVVAHRTSMGTADRTDSSTFVVVPSVRELSTPAVYAEFDRLGLGRDPGELAALPHDAPVNDLQAAAVALLPEIEATLAAVRGAGADHALVSGSGPTVFGSFASADAARAAAEQLEGAVHAEPVDARFGEPRRA